MPNFPYVIETSQLSLHYGSKKVLDRLTVQIQRGGIHALIGANGAGKSSLFRTLLGFEVPSGGSARILGQDCRTLTPDVRARIGYVSDEHVLPNWMRVEQLTRMQRLQYQHWNQSRYDEVLRNFNVQQNQKVSELSRGERAGLSLALALGQNPELLILDEPTLGMDVVAKRTFLEALMFSEAPQKTTIIYCSHQMEEIERIADHVIIIENGRLRHMSEPGELCERVSLWAADLPRQADDTRELPGLLEFQNIDDISHLLMFDAPADFDAQLVRMGARNITHTSVSLARAVSGVLAAGHWARNNKPSGNHHA
jgi:ABC-2 type transport system ATP-binding protein